MFIIGAVLDGLVAVVMLVPSGPLCWCGRRPNQWIAAQ
jgi:hypothetical protein